MILENCLATRKILVVLENIHTRLALKVPIDNHTVLDDCRSSGNNSSRLPSNLAFDTFLITEPERTRSIADHISPPGKGPGKTCQLCSFHACLNSYNLKAIRVVDKNDNLIAYGAICLSD